MLKKSLITIVALTLIFSPLGSAPTRKARASEGTDALVEAILKAAASALSQALADALTKEETSAAKAEANNTKADAQGAGQQRVPTTNPTEEALIKEGNKTKEKEKDQTFWQWAEEFVQTVLQKAILDVVVDQIITYIQGGGKPQFVTDWQGFLEDAGQRAAGDFVKSLGAGFLCEPFSLELQIAFTGGEGKKFSEEAECTLDDIVENIENFGNDFREGGWIAYGESWKVQNNFIGGFINITERLGLEKEAAELAALNEAASGKGFLSTKKCTTDSAGKKTCKLVTPGSTLGDLTSKALGSDIDFLLNAEQLGDYVSAIVDALLNRVIEEGLAAASD
ncbi:MAG: Uncharacterized protein G01um101419_568 [Parcubacteria group bacterium Gr01-1014_19]|nr:MAG: Uncharacterized protein G01um101419_568 [Parcubacteria group bacterium Gr01-1014_19]